MRRWFLDRYEDPANETPWDGEGKEYVFVWGGPYDPDDEIQSRFTGIVEFDTMWELIEELWSDFGDKWAPIKHEYVDYDEYVSHPVVIDRSDPNRFLEERIAEIFAVVCHPIFVDNKDKIFTINYKYEIVTLRERIGQDPIQV